jgi:hypothetical protein
MPYAHPKTIGLLSRSTQSPAVYAPRNTSWCSLPPGNTCDLHGTSGNVGSCRGGMKGSTFSRSSQYLSTCRSSFWGVSLTYCTTLTQSTWVPLSLPRPRTSCAPSSSPHSRRQATSLTFAHSSVSHLPYLHQQGPSSPDPVPHFQASSIRITVFASTTL